MDKVTIGAVMTAPRYELTYCRTVIEKALQKLGIPLTVSGGVFYGQCMQNMLEDLVSKNVDYAVTVDFDSVFTAEQLHRLISIVSRNEHVDAIAPLQVRRGKRVMLGTLEDQEQEGDLVKGKTAHFGLTVLDLKKLANVPKPWFCAKPDEHGSWGENKTDDDAAFWLAWRDAGNSVYFDLGTRIGHVEEMVVMHNEVLQPTHYYPHEWNTLNDSGNHQTLAR